MSNKYLAPCPPGVYISETVHKSVRSSLGVIQSLSVSVGILLVYVSGFLTTWRYVAVICGSTAFVSIFLMVFLPETPYWLVEVGREKEAW